MFSGQIVLQQKLSGKFVAVFFIQYGTIFFKEVICSIIRYYYLAQKTKYG